MIGNREVWRRGSICDTPEERPEMPVAENIYKSLNDDDAGRKKEGDEQGDIDLAAAFTD
jgi:hypothetical protein